MQKKAPIRSKNQKLHCFLRFWIQSSDFFLFFFSHIFKMTSNGLLDCEPAKKPTFSIYGFDRRLVKAVATEFKFVHPTDVQDQTFCEALKGRDIYVCARTGIYSVSLYSRTHLF